MKKFSLFMLMAVGLLISSSMSAMPERPVLGQQEPQFAELRISPQGVEQLVPMATPQPKHSQSSLARAPRKAAMAGDVLKVVKPSGEEVFYDATNFNTVWGNLVAGDSIVLLGNIGTCGAYIIVDNVTLNLNGHYLVSSYKGENLTSQLYLLITMGDNIVIENGYIWDDNYRYLKNGSWTSSNMGVEAWGGSLTLKNVTTDGDYCGSAYMIYAGNNATVEIKDCEINSCFYAIYNAGADITINQSEGKDCKLEGYYSSTIYQTKGSITLNGGTITNSDAMCVAIYGGDFTMEGGVVSTSVDHTIFVYPYATTNVGSTVTIKGGTIENTATTNGTYQYNASCICMIDYYAATLKVYGGEFKPSTTYRGCAIFASCSGGGPKVYVEGGKFYSPLDHSIIFVKVAETTFDVKGGFFEQPSTGKIALPTGYSFLPQNEDGFYEVSNVLFSIEGKGGYSYNDIQTAWEDGDNLTLKRPTTVEDGDITITKSVSLDLTDYSMEKLIVSTGKTVDIFGTRGASIKEIAGEGIVVIHAGTYPFDPEAYLADGLSARKNENTNMWVVGEGTEVSMEGVEYWTLADAIAAAPQDEQVTITLLRSILMSKGVSISAKQNIVLELNGKQISCDEHMVKPMAAMIENRGTLTIQDNTDTEKNGLGTGLMAYAFLTPNPVVLPGSTSNVITNRGTLYVKSGAMYNDAYGAACYDIDNYANGNDAFLYITGGKFTTKASMSIRMCTFKSTKNIVSIKNAIVGSFWLQEYNGTEGQGYIEFDNCEFLYNVVLGYDEDNAELVNLSVIIKNTEINGEFVSIFDPAARAQDSAYVMDNNVVRAYFLDYPYACLTNGFYQFATPRYYKLMNGSDAKNYTEDDGWICIPSEEHPGFIDVYMSPEKLLREFNKNLMPGYGLVPRPNFRGEDNWYEVVPLQGTTDSEDVEGHDDELGNPWHQDRTWDLTEDDVVPQDTTPVHIDHDVYVETDTKADAASIIVESEQTLTVQTGATLIVGNGGIVFNNEEGKTPGQIIIEPGATLLDGANGIISDDMKNVVIQASETEQGTFLFDPEVSLNTHPYGTVELISRSGLRKYPNGNLVNYWHRFASPVMELTKDNFTNNWDTYSATTGLEIAAGTYFQTQIFQWSTYLRDWERIDNKGNYCDSIVPFQGYTMLNNCTWDQDHKGGVTYTFRGNLVGNHNDDLTFLSKGYNYFGNSYTAPIHIKELLEAVDNDDINRTVYIWDAELQVFRGWSFEQLLYVDDETCPASIPSMQTFVMQLLSDNSVTSHIDYVSAIWEPVVNAVTSNKAPQKAQQVLDATLKINIAAANGEKDAVVIMKDGRYSNQLDNGADAEKYMNNGSVNLYAHAEFANVSTMADAEIEGTKLSLVSNDETDFIMTFSAVSGEQYAIRDNFTGSVVTIAEGNTYAFSTNANSTEENRFEIVAVRRAPTDSEKISTNATAKGIYSVTGQYLGEVQDWFNLPAGVYVMDGQKIVK